MVLGELLLRDVFLMECDGWLRCERAGCCFFEEVVQSSGSRFTLFIASFFSHPVSFLAPFSLQSYHPLLAPVVHSNIDLL
jgi:hypothetical protein